MERTVVMRSFRLGLCRLSLGVLLLIVCFGSESLFSTGSGTSATTSPSVQTGFQPPDAPAGEELGRIDSFSPEFDSLLPQGARIEKLAEGFDWSEGPVWVPSEGCLLFSDVPQNVVYRWKEGQGLSEYLRPSGFTGSSYRGKESGSNGLTLDREGRLVLCQHGDRRVSRLLPGGGFQTLASEYQGKRFNSPNDLVFRSNGDLYFTDPPYGLDGLNQSPDKELSFNGVFLLRTSGELILLTDRLTFPNGVALSPDERTLYVAVSDPSRPALIEYSLIEGGLLGPGHELYDFTPESGKLPGGPDGLKTDLDGRIYCTSPGGVSVISPDGRQLGRFTIGVATANCAWGDGGSTLYITADSYLCRVKLKSRGNPGR